MKNRTTRMRIFTGNKYSAHSIHKGLAAINKKLYSVMTASSFAFYYMRDKLYIMHGTMICNSL